MANYISQHTGAQIDSGVTKANSAVQPSDLTTAIANKQDNLVSGTNIKSLNSTTLLGTGNIDINKTTLGLNNVDNTADLAKPISTATQTALNGKAASAHTHATTDVSGLDTALSGKAASAHNHVTSDVTGLDTALNGKVDKEAGKGLSSSDYTDTEKTKLAGIADNANNYTHPANHPASIITQDASNRFVTDAEKAAWTATLDAPLSFTYTGTLAAAPTAYQTAPMLPAPSGKEWVGWVSMAQIGTGVSGITFPNLEGVGAAFSPSNMAALTSLSLPALTTVGSTFSPNNMAALTSLSVPALTIVGANFSPNTMAALTSLSLPALTTVGTSFNPSSMAALTSLSLPAIERIGTSLASGDVINISAAVGALTSFILPATLKQVGGTGGNVTITSAMLNQASVDSILVRLAALDGTNGTTAFNNRTVTITGTSAAPSATGLSAKATLVARGCTVTHK